MYELLEYWLTHNSEITYTS